MEKHVQYVAGTEWSDTGGRIPVPFGAIVFAEVLLFQRLKFFQKDRSTASFTCVSLLYNMEVPRGGG